MNSETEQWVAQLRKGTLELCILALLAGEERYGYQIAQGLAGTDGLAVGEGTVYPLLSRLQREGLVDSSWHASQAGPPRKYYRLTAVGREMLAARVQLWEELNRSVGVILKEVRDGKSGNGPLPA